MEVRIIEENKNKMVFEIEGESHTLSNMLRKELWNDSHIKAAAYGIEHPLVDIPRITVQTDGAEPRKAVVAAVKRIQKQVDKVKDEAKKIK